MNGIFQFNLKPLININLLKSFFYKLEIDNNDKKLYGLTPFRSRQILYTEYNKGKLKVVNKQTFVQNVSDIRSKERKFSILIPTNKQINILSKLLNVILSKAKKNNIFVADKLDVTFHFVKIHASKTGVSNSPEGIHRDGFDILVPCLVIERNNIKGGFSRFFLNKKIVFNRVIKEGRCLVVEENKNKELFHDVTPIVLDNKDKEGYRSIIGIDINFI
jgi:hypothetical protein